MSNLSDILWREQVAFNEMILNQHAYLDLYIASSLKQSSADRHVASLGHIILIPSQTVFAFTP